MNEQRDIVPTSVAASGAAGRNVIAVIGIDRYRTWRSLAHAVSDARGTRALFHRLGFEDASPPLYDEQATGAALQALVTDDLMSLSRDDSLVLFYAGHGGTRIHEHAGQKIKTGYLIPVDAARARNKVATWIDLESWLRRVALLPPKHILVILDACYSGIALAPVFKWRDDMSPPDLPLATLCRRPSRRIITSALDDQVALDSGPVPGHSLFTGCLIEALRGGITAEAGVTTGSALGLWVQERVQKYPRSEQTPDFGAFDLDDRGEMAIPLLGARDGINAITTTTTDASKGAPASASASAIAEPMAATTASTAAAIRSPVRRDWRSGMRQRWKVIRERNQVWIVAGIVFWIVFAIGSLVASGT